MKIKVLDDLVFYNKRFNEIIKGNLSSKEYTEQLIKENNDNNFVSHKL